MAEPVVLGLSGGVDSAVAAKLLLARGFSVHGLWLDIGLGGGEDAAAVAHRLGIPFHTADIRAELERDVCAPFAAEYLAGRTPLPCARCNRGVKFPALLALADRLGGCSVATGHYARVTAGPDGAPRLCKGRPSNDQSYMLARLTPAQLARTYFPLGDLDKTQVRAMAAAWDIPVADKPDSMEICFIPRGDYPAWMARRGPTPPPGDFVDEGGAVLGRHRGYHCYTLGQRRGLGVSAAGRLFVSAICPEENRVVLSDGSDLWRDRVEVTELNELAPFADGASGQVRLRHAKTQSPATLCRAGTGGLLHLSGAARAPTPGQLAVFYQGDVVVASGWIHRTK